MSENIPADLKYTKSHEWVRIQGDAAVVGITDHAQHELTDVVFVELPAVGRKLKTASDIYAPVGGEVAEINPELAGKPELVNRDPYQAGWFFKLKPAEAPEAGRLLSPDEYARQIAP